MPEISIWHMKCNKILPLIKTIASMTPVDVIHLELEKALKQLPYNIPVAGALAGALKQED
jgi:hypothetical protein